MAADRMRQINELIRVELAREFSTVLELPEGTIVSITKVVTAPDLRHATIYLSILPDQMTGSALTIIRKQFSRILEEASPRIQIRTMPKFRLILDGTERKAAQIERLLDSIKD
jgi:ribosome-binding factor A